MARALLAEPDHAHMEHANTAFVSYAQHAPVNLRVCDASQVMPSMPKLTNAVLAHSRFMERYLLSGSGPRTRQPTHNNLGTINGCYIPCLLNILGAPLFLFVGFAVGMMGWVGALGLFFFSELIAYLTITSFSALVTNGQMKGGGAYYMISRSLGPAFGGSSGMCGRLTHPATATGCHALRPLAPH